MWKLTKVGCLGLVAIFGAWLLMRWIGRQIPATVASGEKSYAYGLDNDFGYSVTQARWQTNGFTIRIWADSTLDLTFEVPHFELKKVKTQRWLAHDRAILLEIEYEYHDSGAPENEMSLVYDYELGQLSTLGGSWLASTPEGLRSRAISRIEFDTLIRRLSEPRRPYDWKDDRLPRPWPPSSLEAK